MGKQQLVKPPEPDAELINSQISLIITKLIKAFLFLQVNVTVQSSGILTVIVTENIFGLAPPINALSLFFVF